MPDSDIALKGFQSLFAENLIYQAIILVFAKIGAVKSGDASTFLSPVLKCI
jgi:hypothetical protein